jgi:hypothetical protein
VDEVTVGKENAGYDKVKPREKVTFGFSYQEHSAAAECSFFNGL